MLNRLMHFLFAQSADAWDGFEHLPQRLRARHSALLHYSRHP